MCPRHLRQFSLEAATTQKEFQLFCERYGSTPFISGAAKRRAFREMFVKKASQFGLDSDTVQRYLKAMRLVETTEDPAWFRDGAIPTGGA